MKILVLAPPMLQLNAPYAALPVLNGILRNLGHSVQVLDTSIGLFQRIFCAGGFSRIFAGKNIRDEHRIRAVLDPVLRFVRTGDPSLAAAMLRPGFLPQSPSFQVETDDPRQRVTWFLQDLAGMVTSVSPQFRLTSYGAALEDSLSSFDALEKELANEDPLDSLLGDLCVEEIQEQPDCVLITCPFPGTLLGALRLARHLRTLAPKARIVLGGGYPSTELRNLSDPRIFSLIDLVAFDDASLTLPGILAWKRGKTIPPGCAGLSQDRVVQVAMSCAKTLPAAPSYQGIDLSRYVDLCDNANPMHRLWNEGRWLRLTAAQGCYHQRCRFCDTTLPYIRDYARLSGKTVADRMENLYQQTGLDGFHFVDEAVPPALLCDVAIELLTRGRAFRFWGNIRFEPYFTPDRCRLLARAGCIAVTGGLEAVCPRVLQQMDKGVSTESAVRTLAAFAQAGILTHTYLMHAWPGMTLQEVSDSAEIIRQCIERGIITSAFWHRFTLTAHSSLGANPQSLGISIRGPKFQGFARNNLRHHDPSGADAPWIGEGLNRAMHAWMQGEGLTASIPSWFSEVVPKPSFARKQIGRWIEQDPSVPGNRWIWLGGDCYLSGKTLEFTDEYGRPQSLEGDKHSRRLVETVIKQAFPGTHQNVGVLEVEPEIAALLHPLGLVRV